MVDVGTSRPATAAMAAVAAGCCRRRSDRASGLKSLPQWEAILRNGNGNGNGSQSYSYS